MKEIIKNIIEGIMGNLERIIIVIVIIITLFSLHPAYDKLRSPDGRDITDERKVYNINLISEKTHYYYMIDNLLIEDFRINISYEDTKNPVLIRQQDYKLNSDNEKVYLYSNDFKSYYGCWYKLILPYNFKIGN